MGKPDEVRKAIAGLEAKWKAAPTDLKVMKDLNEAYVKMILPLHGRRTEGREGREGDLAGVPGEGSAASHVDRHREPAHHEDPRPRHEAGR